MLCTGVPLRSTPAYNLVAPMGLSPACVLAVESPRRDSLMRLTCFFEDKKGKLVLKKP